jgi:hypothetical protein
MDDFDQPEPWRLHLSGGKFVDIRKRLTHGEAEDMFACMSPHGERLNRRDVRTAKIDAYLLTWNLTKRGEPVPMSPQLPGNERLDTIRAMNADRAVEIHTAIEAHEAAMTEERDALKKTLAGLPAGNATSPLPSDPAFASTPSVT